MANIDNYIEKAEKFYSQQKFEDAIYWFTRAISHSPSADLYSERAVSYYHNGQLAESLQDMNRAQELEPERPYRYSSRAYIRDAMGDVEGAVADYETTIKLDPEDAIAHNNLGLLIEKLGHHKKAKVFFDFADSLAKDEQGNPNAVAERPRNIQKEVNQDKKQTTVGKEVAKVFTSGEQFKEFLRFVSNGFKQK